LLLENSYFFTVTVLIVLMLSILGYLTHHFKMAKFNLYFFFIVIFTLDEVLQSLSFFFPVLKTEIISGHFNLINLINFAIISILSCDRFLRNCFRKATHLTKESDTVRFSKNLIVAIPFTLAIISLFGSALLHQGWLQPLICVIAFSPYLISSNSLVLRDLHFSLIVALFLVMLASFVSLIASENVFSCRADKCFLVSNLISSNGNAAGLRILFLGIGIVATSQTRDLWKACIVIEVLLVLNGARTSLYTFTVCSIFFLIPGLPNQISNSVFKRTMILVSFLISLLPLIRIFPDSSFTFRGQLWNLARRESLSDFSHFSGSSDWVRLGDSLGFTANYGAHNIWLDFGYSFGIVGMLTLFVWFSLLTYYAPHLSTKFLIIPMAFLLAGTTESVLLFWKTNSGLSLLILLMYLISAESLDLHNRSNRKLPASS